MVEAGESREAIRARIKTTFVETFATMDTHELKIEEESGNVQVRQSWDEAKNVMVNFAEQKVIDGIVPDDFKPFFDNWDTLGAGANDTIESLSKVGSDDGVDTMKVVAKAPWPISNRIMFSTRYLESEDGGHMMLFCSAGNERYAADEAIFTAKEKKKLVVATVFCSGWWVKPVKNAEGAVTGTNMLYYSCIEAGGNIPTFVQNSQGPKTALNSIKGAVAWAKASKK